MANVIALYAIAGGAAIVCYFIWTRMPL